MTVRGKFEVKGLDGYLEELVKAGKDVDLVVTDVLNAAAPIAHAELETNLRKTSETWTGAAAKTVFTTEVKHEGNYHFIEIGADVSQDPAALYKEYGRAHQAAEPFIRPSFRKLRQSKLKQMMKEVMQAFGL